MNNEEEHIDVREKLRKLPRAKARDGFENELLRRINLLDTGTVKAPASKSSFWESLFGKRSLAWTIPATSLVVIAIVFVGVYFAFYNTKDMQKTSDNKSSANQQSSIESLKINPLAQETTKDNIPGKDIANDLEINKSPSMERKSDLDKGLNETFVEPSPKPVAPSKVNVIDSKKESTIYEKAEDVGQTGKTIKKAEEKEVGNINNGVLKEQKKDESYRSKEPEKKISAPLIKDVEKVKSEKSDGKAKDKEDTKKKASKDLTKEILEKLKEKIKDN